MDYFAAGASAVTLVSTTAKLVKMFPKKNIVCLLSRKTCVRKFVGFLERNHLTRRSREDIYYGTRSYFQEDTVLSCFNPELRTPVRPKNFVRRLMYDIKHASDDEIVRLDSNLQIRNVFRNASLRSEKEALSNSSSAPANNHPISCVVRNAASNLLCQLEYPKEYMPFSISGAQRELKTLESGYRGHHQASDYAVESRADVALSAHPALLSNKSGYGCVAISTDTVNHLSTHEKSGLLGNGVCLLSYTPNVIINNTQGLPANTEKISVWDGDTLVTYVNGGGEYREEMWANVDDIEYVDCPNGNLMLCYVESFRSVHDPTHSFVAEIPFAMLLRGSRHYDYFKEKLRIRRVSPLTIQGEVDSQGVSCTYSCLSVRHSDVVQITNNTTRRTEYFSRTELSALRHMAPGRAATLALRRDPPRVFNKLCDHDRMPFLRDLGFRNLGTILLNCPQVNFPSHLDESRKQAVKEIMTAAALNDLERLHELIARAEPFVRDQAHRDIDRLEQRKELETQIQATAI